MCMAANNCKLQERVDAIDERVTRLEENMTTGFNTVTSAVNQLATDFGSRMNTLDQKVVDEKAKWGESFRRWLNRVVNLMIAGCCVAMGVTALKLILSM